jgi:DNA mismatch endonuclease (patch repair protein)
MDRVDKETRSRTMQAIRSRGNRSTEARLRAALARGGVRGWRLHDINLSGTPDFAFSKERIAVFVDGCFWHGCPSCYRRPHSSRAYWDAKVLRNKARDRRVDAQLRSEDWSVIRIWEHSLSDPKKVVAEITAAIQNKKIYKRQSRPS